MSLGPNLGLLVGVINRPLKTLGWQLFYEIFRLDTVKIIPLLVLVWNLMFLSKNSILCGESSSTYQSHKNVTLFFSSSSLIPLFPFYFLQFQRVSNRFPSLLMLKIGSTNQGSINWYQSFGSWNHVLSILCVLCFMCVSYFICSVNFFCLNLYYYFIFLCFISLSLSFFSKLYLVSISLWG